ncbi:MAG: prepilin-type N-terminal cleavage/methylation domain-containing protein [Patescibacteria group bacterium]
MKKGFALRVSKGFTLIEILIVITVIGILASISIVGYDRVSTAARDSRRKADLESISIALTMYHQNEKSWILTGSGYLGTGEGYFNAKDAVSYPKSIAKFLVEKGYLSTEPKDPKLKVENGIALSERPQYMVYQCHFSGNINFVDGGVIYAQLEKPSASDIATYTEAKTQCNDAPAAGNNYAVIVR